jgi:hypothetical protein
MSIRAKARARCVVCGSSKGIEHNHVGGRNHVAWFTMPLCREHHEHFHAFVRSAGIDLEYTSDPRERLCRASKSFLAAQWVLTEALQNISQSDK